MSYELVARIKQIGVVRHDDGPLSLELRTASGKVVSLATEELLSETIGGEGPPGPGSFIGSVIGVLTIRTGTIRLYNDYGRALTISSVRATVSTAPTGAAVLVDVNKNGTTIFTTQANRPSIAVNDFSSTKAVPDVTILADGEYLTFDIDQVGSTIAGADLTVALVVS